ncbi:CBS domain-containing protein [Streptomyces sp. NPDC046237]|uniref:CBS domain-containing protein n=1 Tax=Streptomyces sp. NPDC046237 TaxID=3154914 RepID=UPI0033CEF57F
MRARDLAWPCTPVQPDATLREAAELLVRERTPALVVVSKDGSPLAAVPASQILAAALPDAVREDSLLLATGVDASLDRDVRTRTASLRLTDVLPEHLPTPAVVGPNASLPEMTAVMGRTGSPVVLVVDYDDQPHLIGTVDATTLLQQYL